MAKTLDSEADDTPTLIPQSKTPVQKQTRPGPRTVR